MILSTNQKLVRVGKEYSAGNGIEISSYVISYTGDSGQEYIAGENIGINDFVISSRNWTPDITNASESAYQRATDYTNNQISTLSGEVSAEVLQLNSDIDYISGVALTAHQSLDGYLTKASGDEYYQPIGSYATVSQLENTSGEIVNLIPSIEGLATEEYVNEQTSGKADKSEIPDVSQFITNVSAESTYQPIGNYLSSNALEGYATQDWVNEQGYLTEVSIPESATWQDVSTTVQTNSAQWAEGDDEEVNSFVYNNSATINEVNTSYQSNSSTFLTAAPSNMATTGDVAELAQTISETYQVKGDYLTTAFGISESGAWNEATNCVENNSAAWFDNQGDVEVNELVYAQSANWNEVSSKLDSTAFDTWQQGQYTNDIAGLNNLIGTKLDASSFEETSGTFYPTSNPSGFITGVNLSNYYTKDETSGKEELANAFANIPAGDTEVNAYVHNNSASIDESTNVVQSNSAQWAEGGSTSGFVSGTNTLFVPYYPGASDGRVYSANISGDVSVSTGYYSNSGANIDILRTYSLSSVGSQIGDKLNKSVIENSKTLSIIDNKAEVYSFAYKPSELVFTGITVNNYSSPDSVSITTTIQPPYKLYSACLVIESDGFDTNRIPNGWNFVNSANGSATFSRFYKNQSYDSINFPGFWDYSLTNASAYSVAYSGLVIDALAFKSDLTGVAGDPEVNSLVHTNSATWNTVSDKLDTTAFSNVSGTFLTAHQSLEGYATVTLVEETSGSITSLIPTNYYPDTNPSGFISGVDLSPYATTAEVDTLSSMLSGAIDYVSANVSGGVTGEFVPLSSFNELKQSYDALSSLFATYSGQWLLPNEGV